MEKQSPKLTILKIKIDLLQKDFINLLRNPFCTAEQLDEAVKRITLSDKYSTYNVANYVHKPMDDEGMSYLVEIITHAKLNIQFLEKLRKLEKEENGI